MAQLMSTLFTKLGFMGVIMGVIMDWGMKNNPNYSLLDANYLVPLQSLIII